MGLRENHVGAPPVWVTVPKVGGGGGPDPPPLWNFKNFLQYFYACKKDDNPEK